MRKSNKQQGNSNIILFLVFGIIVFLVYKNYDGFSPFPTPRPTPEQTLDEYTSSLIRTIDGIKDTEILIVAENYKKVSEEIKSLSNPLSKSELKRPQDAINKINELNRQSLGENYSKWTPFFEKISFYLEKRDEDDPLHNDRTIYCVGEYFELISKGLELHSINPEDLYTLPTTSLNFDIHLIAQPQEKNGFETIENIESKYENGEITGALIDDPSQPEWIRELAREGTEEFNAATANNNSVRIPIKRGPPM